MKEFFCGKRGGLVAFGVIAGLVVGGLGWVTQVALRLEDQQLEARRQVLEAQSQADVRLALWRLDTRMFTDLAREASRPYHHFNLTVATTVSCRTDKGAQSVSVLELIPIKGAEPSPPWMLRHLIVAAQADWTSPRKLRETLALSLGIPTNKPPPAWAAQDRDPVLWELSNAVDVPRLLEQVRLQEQQLAAVPPGQPGDNVSAVNPANNDSQLLNQPAQGKFDKDALLRMNRAQFEKGQSQANYLGLDEKLGANAGKRNADVTSRGASAPVVFLGPLLPMWLSGATEDRLVVARLVQIGNKPACQVTMLDWPALKQRLKEEISDLAPDARFVPVREPEVSLPERAMTALPVALEAGPVVPANVDPGWTPIRLGLASAWAAALVALAAVGLGGWSLIDLSQRRVRFVSAVTHELRTPLTTLRLYLDMLAGGMIADETRKAEYLQTLNVEAERLNRLVSNVLDFSRLENQRPRLEKKPIPLGELLEQLRTTWEGRCRDAGKDLILENTLGGDLVVTTDVHMVQQIVGNLIDNACKYSRGADDPRLWVRSRREGTQRLVVEVEDRGPGVPLTERRSIFRPFRRGHSADVTAGGVGLGLALALRWTQLLGGRLSLHPIPETTGACFRLELPL